MAIFDSIGGERMETIIRRFYQRCFEDFMIGHFFFGKDHEQLVASQYAFAVAMLGGPRDYQGQGLGQVHESFRIRPAQFMRRRKILEETMDEFGLESDLAAAWLEAEDRLKNLVMNQDLCR